MKKFSTCLFISLFLINCLVYSNEAQNITDKTKPQITTNNINKVSANSNQSSLTKNTNQSLTSGNSNQNSVTQNPSPIPLDEKKPLIELKDGQNVTLEIKQGSENQSWDYLRILSFLVSVLAFSVSVVTATFLYKGFRLTQNSFKLSAYQMRLSSRIHFQDLLIENTRSKIANPELWGVWDTHFLHDKSIIEKPETADYARLQSQAYITINIFEIVFGFYNDSPNLPDFPELKKEEKESYEAWREYLEHFIRNSTIARDILFVREETKRIYNKRFLDEIEKIQKKLEEEEEEKKLAEEKKLREASNSTSKKPRKDKKY